MADERRQWLTGVLDLCALAVLARGEQHGYGLAVELERFGVGRVKGGTLYPMLSRMEKEDLVSFRWQPGEGGPARKYYRLTEAGRERLEERGRGWLGFARNASLLLGSAMKEAEEVKEGSDGGSGRSRTA